MKHEIVAMRASGGGAIVNTSSGLGLVAVANQSAYIAAKHGVLGLTKAAALEYVKEGIRVNAVCPGIIRTPMAARGIAGNPAVEEALAKIQPIGRLGEPDEVANAALFLLSDAASFITGESLAVDGGYLRLANSTARARSAWLTMHAGHQGVHRDVRSSRWASVFWLSKEETALGRGVSPCVARPEAHERAGAGHHLDEAPFGPRVHLGKAAPGGVSG